MLLKELAINEDDEEISKSDLEMRRSIFAQLAQKVYDDWDEDEDEFAGGGICHLIADEFCDYLSGKGIECASVNTQIGDNHVYTVVKTTDGVVELDISPYTYERGGGYSWEKVHDIEFDANDVQVNTLSSDPEEFDQFVDEF